MKLANNTTTIDDSTGDATFTGSLTYKGKIVNRIIVGTKGGYATIKEAVDWFNASATANTELLLDGINHLVADTITVNNASYTLTIRGIGTALTNIDASTGLTNKPMFDIKTKCDFDRLTLRGYTLASYGTQATENAMNFTGTNAVFYELSNIKFYNFNMCLYDTVGVNILLASFSIINTTTAGYRCNTAGSNAYINADLGYTYNCPIGFDLLKANTGGFYIYDVNFVNVGSQIAVKYTGGAGNYVYAGLCTIVGCSYNNTGTFFSGFDFSRPDGRDANIYMQYNAGTENKNPHAKVNMIDNAAATTITAVNTWYKAVFTSKVILNFNATPTGCTFTITANGETTGAIAYNATPATMAANIKTAMDALSFGTVTVANITGTNILALSIWSITYDTATDGWWEHSADIASLTSVTNAYFDANDYTTKWTLSQNRVTYQPTNSRDVEMWISCNLLCDRNSARIDAAIARYDVSNVFKGYYGRTTATSINTSAHR